ncbi:hypothetical protein [Hyphomonas sp.]|nr:hypothetical protein [Hyphomonas sp.]
MRDNKSATAAPPVSVGRRLKVWHTRIETEAGKLIVLTTQSQMNL